MKFLMILVASGFANPQIAPSAFPVFLKEGFSSILEFEEAPSQVVLGDQNLFQVERLNRSIVIKPLAPYAVTNMFVYFKDKETKLFLLSASEEAEPTYYKKFETILPKIEEKTKTISKVTYSKGLHIKSIDYDSKKDFLTINFVVAADSAIKIAPNWELVRLKYKDRILVPSKIWSERREVQRDTAIRARLVFTKPNVPTDFKDVNLVVPVKGTSSSLTSALKGARK